MIDIHCHILPGVDDGAFNTEESIAMAKLAVADGIRTIVATPHTLNGVSNNSLQDVTGHVETLRKIFSNEDLNLDLLPGSEIHLCVRIMERVASGEVATINDNRRYALVEFPVHAIPIGYKDELFHLKVKGITPVIVHPERNLVFRQKPDILFELAAMGCLFQITALSITGGFGSDTKAFAHKMLKCRLGHVIASDAHSAEGRPPLLSQAVEVAGKVTGDKKKAEEMVTTIPEAIIEGKPVYPPEPESMQKKKRSFFKFW